MRAFVLSTGRCGSMTLARAFEHAINYTAGHETRVGRLGDRLDYPDRHIESDPRLSWFLGSLDRAYGDEPLYVHLWRDPDEVARSIARRFETEDSFVRAFASTMIVRAGGVTRNREKRLRFAKVLVSTIEDNIALFLRDKTAVIEASLPDLQPGFDEAWERLGAEGDLEAAHTELEVRHNRSEP